MEVWQQHGTATAPHKRLYMAQNNAILAQGIRGIALCHFVEFLEDASGPEELREFRLRMRPVDAECYQEAEKHAGGLEALVDIVMARPDLVSKLASVAYSKWHWTRMSRRMLVMVISRLTTASVRTLAAHDDVDPSLVAQLVSEGRLRSYDPACKALMRRYIQISFHKVKALWDLGVRFNGDILVEFAKTGRDDRVELVLKDDSMMGRSVETKSLRIADAAVGAAEAGRSSTTRLLVQRLVDMSAPDSYRLQETICNVLIESSRTGSTGVVRALFNSESLRPRVVFAIRTGSTPERCVMQEILTASVASDANSEHVAAFAGIVAGLQHIPGCADPDADILRIRDVVDTADDYTLAVLRLRRAINFIINKVPAESPKCRLALTEESARVMRRFIDKAYADGENVRWLMENAMASWSKSVINDVICPHIRQQEIEQQEDLDKLEFTMTCFASLAI